MMIIWMLIVLGLLLLTKMLPLRTTKLRTRRFLPILSMMMIAFVVTLEVMMLQLYLELSCPFLPSLTVVIFFAGDEAEKCIFYPVPFI